MGVIQGDTPSLDYGSYANKQSGPLPRHHSNFRLVVQPRLLINKLLPLTGIVIGILRLGPLKGRGFIDHASTLADSWVSGLGCKGITGRRTRA